MRALFSSPAITMTTTIMATITTTNTTTMAPLMVLAATEAMATMTAMVAPWLVTANGTVHTLTARKMAKLWRVKLAINKILNAGDFKQQAAILWAVVDQPAFMHGMRSAICGQVTRRQMIGKCVSSSLQQRTVRKGNKI
jgi:hypothetical protein